MKLTKIFGIVLSLHVGVILLVMFQPGCQVLKKFKKGGDDNNATTGTESPETSVDPAFNAGDGAAETAEAPSTTGDGRFPPTRPAGELIVPGTPGVPSVPSAPDGAGLSAEGVTVYKIARGDTLWGIARKNNVSLNALLGANPGMNKDTPLKIGQEVLLPAGGSSGAAAVVEPSAPVPSGSSSYVVKAGDSLTRIAALHGTTISDIVRLNGLANANAISVGQTLVVPAGGTVAPAPVSPPAAGGSTYVVRKGDNLTRIASQNGTTVAEIMQLNGLTNANSIREGQTLVVSATDAPPPATPAPVPVPAIPAPPNSPVEEPKAPDGGSLEKFFKNKDVPVVEAPDQGNPNPPRN